MQRKIDESASLSLMESLPTTMLTCLSLTWADLRLCLAHEGLLPPPARSQMSDGGYEKCITYTIAKCYHSAASTQVSCHLAYFLCHTVTALANDSLVCCYLCRNMCTLGRGVHIKLMYFNCNPITYLDTYKHTYKHILTLRLNQLAHQF